MTINYDYYRIFYAVAQSRSFTRAAEMLLTSGFLSVNFSGNMGVIKTRPGYASSLAYNIDNGGLPSIIGTIAGDDTIFIVIKEGETYANVVEELRSVIPDIK